MTTPSDTQDLLDKIRALPEDKIPEVIDFVEFLQFKASEQGLARATAALSEPSFAKVWDNADDAEYDNL